MIVINFLKHIDIFRYALLLFFTLRSTSCSVASKEVERTGNVLQLSHGQRKEARFVNNRKAVWTSLARKESTFVVMGCSRHSATMKVRPGR